MTINSGHLKLALSNLRTSRSRSFLTMFGIIIGVASAITIVGIDSGVTRVVSNQVNAYSKNVITINSDVASTSIFGGYTMPISASTLTTKDVNAIAKIKNIQDIVPLSVIPGAVSANKIDANALVIATTPNFLKVINQSLVYGNFFNNQYLNQNSAVIGANIGSKIFNSSIALGDTINFRNQQLIVSGILNSFNNSPFSNVSIFNNAVFIPDSLAQQITASNNLNIYQILVKVDKSENLSTVAKNIQAALIKSHSGQADFSVLLPSQLVKSKTSILTLLADLTIGTAIISLFVGGIGIMNVMLVSVTERTHEIGIRKAIGATNQQIRNQFIVEALTVSIFGGLIGILLSLGAILIINLTTSLSAVVSWPIMVVAFVISVVIGVVFGSIPAIKASTLQPIEALRSE